MHDEYKHLYTTPNLDLATALTISGIPLETMFVTKLKKVVFVFKSPRDDKEACKITNDYFDGELILNARDLLRKKREYREQIDIMLANEK